MDNATIYLDDSAVFSHSKRKREHVEANLEGGGVTVKSVGLRWFHPAGFTIDRPNGLREFTFVQWLTPTILKIDGETSREEPGGCIFYRPGDPTWYAGDAFSPFGNNWFHFTGPAAASMIEDCAIPMNRPLRLRDDSFIEPAIRTFLRETMSESFCRHIALSAHAMMFLVEFGRQLRRNAIKAMSARNMELRKSFEEFRVKLRVQCAEQWTVGRMAAELHLSSSRFSNLYREFFDAKPVDDVIRMRVELAEYYLRTTVIPVNYVAELCGFTDIYYFSRTFKAKTGKTATAFRSEQQESAS